MNTSNDRIIDAAGRNVNSISQHWCTPEKYVKAIKEMFDGEIELDPCSNSHSIIHANVEFMLPKNDGLVMEWNYEKIYINPPYGADRKRGTTIKNWLQKCAITHKKNNANILALIPVAPNTTHWKYYIFGVASAICFLYDTRLKFIINGNTDNKGAPMACCMVYWGNNVNKFQNIFSKYGAVVDVSNLIGKKIGIEKEDNVTLFQEEYFTLAQSFA